MRTNRSSCVAKYDIGALDRSASFRASILGYLEKLKGREPGEYRNAEGGAATLYASCFAAMTCHYLGALEAVGTDGLRQWGAYISAHQQPDGLFDGPEISRGRLLSPAHSPEHLREHLTAHALPALDLLGVAPRHSLGFARRYLDTARLRDWLDRINLRDAWLEGNNLLFAGQFLIWLVEKASSPKAEDSLAVLMTWLDDHVDPRTGLWGTDTSCEPYHAMYGGYHQLLLYYYLGRALPHSDRLVDTVLALQHFDGGFGKGWGGGTCEDVDAIDILVNAYKRGVYRRRDIATALRRCYHSLKRHRTSDGGFAYRQDVEFIHMGMEYTATRPNIGNSFSTWFTVHALCLLAEVIHVPEVSGLQYRFNRICSMGWHHPWPGIDPPAVSVDAKLAIWGHNVLSASYFSARRLKDRSRFLTRAYRALGRVRA